jgi:hypothetical protein
MLYQLMDHSLGVTALNGINGMTATNLMAKDQQEPFANAFSGSPIKRPFNNDCEATAPRKRPWVYG